MNLGGRNEVSGVIIFLREQGASDKDLEDLKRQACLLRTRPRLLATLAILVHVVCVACKDKVSTPAEKVKMESSVAFSCYTRLGVTPEGGQATGALTGCWVPMIMVKLSKNPGSIPQGPRMLKLVTR